MKVYDSITQLIGHTPLLYLKNYSKKHEIEAKLIAKIEAFNPAGSIKDRVAYNMIKKAEENNLINKDTVIIEPTSGNTGIGLASICAAKGYKIILTMPESMSIERRNLLKAYGAKIVLTKKELGMSGAIDKAKELLELYPNSFMPSQFDNKANPEIHYLTTAKEIYDDLEGNIALLVAGIGTGGTISGIGKYLKEKDPKIKIIGVEPEGSPILTQNKKGPHKIQGIGAGFVPANLDTSIYDEIITVKDEDALHTGNEIAKTEGILVGISSGAALFAARKIANEYPNQNIVVIFPDTGERYLSTGMYDEGDNND